MLFGGFARPANKAAQFQSRISLAPKQAVVLLGAGASVSSGCPVMKGFIDRARDYVELRRFSEAEEEDVRISLGLYNALRARFSITEEDVENVENLLSLADLSRLLGKPPIEELARKDLSDHVRRFINAIITKSVTVPGPRAAAWQGSDARGPLVYKGLVRALAYHSRRVTVLTMNHDCLVEYACYCMGLPFTYNRDLADGVEILKLHGSINWLRCPKSGCPSDSRVSVHPVRHVPHGGGEMGYLDIEENRCDECGTLLTPVVVPPTWSKDVDNTVLRQTWSRAVEVLSQAEAFVSVGFSLPVSDAHIRHLIHVGLSSGALRQALAVVGSDAESANRWSSMFRESWRQARLEVHQSTFEQALSPAILPALVVPQDFGQPILNAKILPVSPGFEAHLDAEARLGAAMAKRGIPPGATGVLNGVSWDTVLQGMRRAEPTQHDSVRAYREILEEAGLDWYPDGKIIPAHGTSLLSSQP